jgi:C-terminal processing protease CtpA/Prc
MYFFKTSIITIAISIIFFIGCGGGSSSSVTNNINAKTGIFIDDIVEGIYYKSENSQGFTNSKGEFPFSNEKVEFYIGNIKLGSITTLPTDNKVFIQDLFDLSRDNISDDRVLNIATFLQSLDNDKSTSKIEINNNDFNKFKNINDSILDIDVAEILTNKGFDKKNLDDTKLHLIESFQEHNKYTFDQVEKDFLFNELNTNYYWSSDVINNDYSNFKDPNKMIQSFRNKKLDKWSYAETFHDYIKDGKQEKVGYGCYFDVDKIVFIEIDSPCDISGFKRGDILTKINNMAVTRELFSKTFNNIGVVATYTVSRGMSELNINIAPAVYNFKVSKRSIVTNDKNQKIGYFIYDSFSGKSSSEIEEAFTYFKSNKIDELIVDFRYNGGGSLTIASILLDKLAGYDNDEKLQYTLKDNTSSIVDKATFMKDDNSLDLSRVVFLTSESTASASELVINSLKPYLDVKIIGSKTHGKPVGMHGKYISSKYIYWLINFSMFNADDEGNYFDGLLVNCKVNDYMNSSRGEDGDIVMNEALYYIKNNSCSSLRF